MKQILNELRQIFNEADSDYSEELLQQIVDELEQGNTNGLTDNYYWEFSGTTSPEAYEMIKSGTLNGDGWELVIDDAGVTLEDYDQRVVALLDYLDELDEIDDITPYYGNNNEAHVELPNGDVYSVFSDYNDAIESAKEYLKTTIDDLGIIDLFSMDTLKNFLDTDSFQEMYDEDANFIADEQSEEDLLEFLQQEGRLDEFAELKEPDDESDNELDEDDLDNWELTDEDGAREAFRDNYLSNYNDPVDWYIDMMGEESLEELIKRDSSVIDEDSLIQYVIDSDGPASELARYDGNEIEHEYNGEYYYIYRTD